MNAHDETVLNLMLKQLILFENKQLDLSAIVSSLESLLDEIEQLSKEWEDKFLNEFSTLESINAETPIMEKEEIEKLINEAISNLKIIINDLKKESFSSQEKI